jgi:predicted phosphodiesterase
MSQQNIRTAIAEGRLATKEKELKAARKQLAQAVGALEQARRTRRAPPIAVPHPRRRNGHIVRVCLGDTHGAQVELPALTTALADIKTLDPDEIILLGDHVNCGGFLAQNHVIGYVAETATSYEEDISRANSFLDALQKAAPRARIEYLEGNHERRVERWCVTETLQNGRDAELLRRALAPEFLLRLRQRGIPYRRLAEFHDGLPVPGVIRRGKCFFFHGFSVAKHATAVTQQAIAGNCVFGHTHRHQADVVRRVSAGVIGAWNPGCLCQLQPLWQHGKPTDWTHGYAVQLVAQSGAFLHLNIPIIGAGSQLTALFKL